MAQNLSRSGSLKARAAPGSLRLVQAFVNTRDVETGLEELWNPDALAEWLAGQKLLAAGTELDKAAWRPPSRSAKRCASSSGPTTACRSTAGPWRT